MKKIKRIFTFVLCLALLGIAFFASGNSNMSVQATGSVNLVGTKWDILADGYWTHGNWYDSHHNSDDCSYYYSFNFETTFNYIGLYESDDAYAMVEQYQVMLENTNNQNERRAIVDGILEMAEENGYLKSASVIFTGIECAWDEEDIINNGGETWATCMDNRIYFVPSPSCTDTFDYDLTVGLDRWDGYINWITVDQYGAGVWLGCYNSPGDPLELVGTITGGADATDAEFYHWLQVNGKQLSSGIESTSASNSVRAYKYEQQATRDTLSQAITTCGNGATAIYNELIDLNGTPNEEFTLRITCSNPNLANNDIRLMHYTNGQWVEESVSNVSYSNGVLQLKSTFSSFSPIAILKTPKSNASPATGIATDLTLALATMSIISLMLVAYIVHSKKKKNTNMF